MWKYKYNELYHHGILGMRWGKRNGPPYPLSPGDHSQSEKKAGWRKSLKKASRTAGKKLLNTTDKIFRYKKDKVPTHHNAFTLGFNAIGLKISNDSIKMGANFVSQFMSNRAVGMRISPNTVFVTSGSQFVSGLGVAMATYNTAGTLYNIARNEMDASKYEKEKQLSKDKAKRNKKILEARRSEVEKTRREAAKSTKRSYDPGVNKSKMTYEEKYNEFLDSYTRKKNKNSLFDIDDEEDIANRMDDPNFRKEYGVNENEYKIWKEIMK